jgi:hypothetical protein
MRTALLVALGTLAATEVLAQAPASMVRNGRELRPPDETVTGSRAARAQAQRPVRRSALNARAEQRAVAPGGFNGSWSVAIQTRSGACEPHYRFAVQIINGNLVYEGRPAGRVSPNGAVRVNISAGGQQAFGQGRLSRNYGNGAWRGSGSAGNCAGTWQAGRNG